MLGSPHRRFARKLFARNSATNWFFFGYFVFLSLPNWTTCVHGTRAHSEFTGHTIYLFLSFDVLRCVCFGRGRYGIGVSTVISLFFLSSHYSNLMLFAFDESAKAKQIIRELGKTIKAYCLDFFFYLEFRSSSIFRTTTMMWNVNAGRDGLNGVILANRIDFRCSTVYERNRMKNVSTCCRNGKRAHTPFKESHQHLYSGTASPRAVSMPSTTNHSFALSLGNYFQLFKVFSQIYFRSQNLCHRDTPSPPRRPHFSQWNARWTWLAITYFCVGWKLPASSQVKRQREN